MADHATKQRRFILPVSVHVGPVTYHSHRYGIGTLARLSLKLPGKRKMMLHHFLPHHEIAWHDHPWDFVTLVLLGGYTDESLSDHGIVTDRLRPGSFRRRRAEHAHRTSSDRGALTLVFTRQSRREWCHSAGSADTPRAEWTCQE